MTSPWLSRPGRGTTWSTPDPSDLKLYSIYGPPHHPAGTVHRTKAEAREADET